MTKQNFIPISLNIHEKKVVIVGGGRVALHKAQMFKNFSCKVTVVSQAFRQEFDSLSYATLCLKTYEENDLAGATLVYACTDNHSLNLQIKKDANRAGILASVCNNPTMCDFITPAIFSQDNVSIAVSSGGENVKQAVGVRNQIETLTNQGILDIYQPSLENKLYP